MKLFFKVLFVGLLFSFQARATSVDPKAFVETLANKMMEQIVLNKAPISQKHAMFRKIFLSATDMDIIAKFTLGRYYKTATPAQREAFTQAFTENMVLTWTGRFSNYSGQKMVFQDERSDKEDTYVNSIMDIPNTENDIKIIWRVRNQKDQLKLVDLIVEGVSMIQSYRTEYGSILQQNGGNIDVLIQQLQDKGKQLATNKKS